MNGSDHEPTPEQALDQMRGATQKLREQAWMVSPLTSPVLPAQPDRMDAERQ